MRKADRAAGHAPAAPPFSRISAYPDAEKPRNVRILYLCDRIGQPWDDVVPILEEAGYELETAGMCSGQSSPCPDELCRLVLLDISDPCGQGYQVCAEIRLLSHLPIMLVLRGPACWDVLRGFDMGADTFVTPPISNRELLARLGALLRRVPR